MGSWGFTWFHQVLVVLLDDSSDRALRVDTGRYETSPRVEAKEPTESKAHPLTLSLEHSRKSLCVKPRLRST